MPNVAVYVYKTDIYAVCLRGTITDDAVEIRSLHLNARLPSVTVESAVIESFAFDVPKIFSKAKFLAAKLGDVLDGANLEEQYIFKAVPPEKLEFNVNLNFSAAAEKKIFGREFRAAANFSVSLALRLLITQNRPFLTIDFCGQMLFNALETERFCFEVNFEKPPLPNFPRVSLPSLNIGLPNFGFRLPKLFAGWELPDLPALPDFPIRLPAFTFSLAELPVEISWKSIEVNFAAGKTVIDVRGLRVAAHGHALEGDLHLVLQNGSAVIAESYFNIYRPDFNRLLKLTFDRWHFAENCWLVQPKEGFVNDFLRLLLPELAEESESKTKFALRVLRDGSGRVSEIRLDWKPETGKTFRLPGAKLSLPENSLYTLLFRGLEEGGSQKKKIAFISTFDKTFTAESAFAFNRGEMSNGELDNSRELLDERESQKPFVKLTATPKQQMGVAFMEITNNGNSKVNFLKKLIPFTSMIDSANPVCSPTIVEYTRFALEDWTTRIESEIEKPNFNLDFNAPNLTLPFLQKGGNQFIKITTGKFEPNFNDKIFSGDITATIGVSDGFSLETTAKISFNWEKLAFTVKDKEGISFNFKPTEEKPNPTGNFLGLDWKFHPKKGTNKLFTLVTQDRNYILRQAEGSFVTVKYDKAGAGDSPLIFDLTEFSITPNGINAKGAVRPSPVKLGGLNTSFKFTKGEFNIVDSQLRDICIEGDGAMPPKLVGDAAVKIALTLSVINGSLEISGKGVIEFQKKLECKGTRFEFSLDGMELEFVYEGGRYHFYFTVSGRAKFKPLPSDDDSGPLAWLPSIEMQLLKCPLTDDVSVLSKHVKFLVELPKKATFDFLGCFKMELRGIGFVPHAPMFEGEAAAMELSGQLMFADGSGDVVETQFDFHNLLIGLPAPGKFIPQIHFKDLAIKIRVGDAFALEGSVEYIDGEIEPGLIAKGFAGRGSLEIQGLPTFTAAFTFIRVSRDGGKNFVRAWFIYVQAEKLSLRIPILNIFVREIGLGFGYRYTLASIRRADELDDPRELIKELRRLSLTQGELSRRDQWRVQIENEGEDPRWTIAARALIAQNSAASGMTDWNEKTEAEIPSLFVMDVVLGIRSDLTFLMTARAWLNTNYNDFRENKDDLRSRPLLSGFVLLSPRQRRFLAHFASNPNAAFGNHPMLPEFLKKAISNSRFSATLLIEPGLLHYELGWSNMLQWKDKLGPVNAEFRGGVIFRISRTEIVYGNSYIARGSIELSAKAGGSSVGARISATANVAFGARFIGVVSLEKPLAESGLYGAVGIEVNIRFRVEFWLRLKIGFVKISIDLRFEFSIQLTALLEVGFTPQNLIGARGTATVQLRIMGRNLHFKIHIGVNEPAVNRAFELTNRFLNIGLEATEAEPIPGAPDSPPNVLAPSSTGNVPQTIAASFAPTPVSTEIIEPVSVVSVFAPTAIAAEVFAPQDEIASVSFNAPNYSIYCIPTAKNETGEITESYFLLYPNEDVEKTLQDEKAKNPFYGFLPVPPAKGINSTYDFKWENEALGAGVILKRFDPFEQSAEKFQPFANKEWKIYWELPLGKYQEVNPDLQNKGESELTLRKLLRQAYILVAKPETSDPLEDIVPASDPQSPVSMNGDTPLEDARVYNPSEAAFEAAVRGASEQFEGSPHFKRDENSPYEAALSNAFSSDTTVYSTDGQNSEQAEQNEQALQMRSAAISQMIGDLQRFVELKNAGQATDELTVRSIAFQCGLVFKTENGIPEWLKTDKPAGKITQRTKTDALVPDSAPRKVKLFNAAKINFGEETPQFQRVRHYTDANTVAITWDLNWQDKSKAKEESKARNEKLFLEDYLSHYLVRRRALAGGEREVEIKIKPCKTLSLPSVKEGMKISFVEQTVECKSGGLHVFRPQQEIKIVHSSGKYQTITIAKDADAVQPKKIKVSPDTRLLANKFGVTTETLDGKFVVHATRLQQIRSRFQFVDNFNDEPAEDQAALSRDGKTYVYTVIPVDITGQHSPRPLTVLATRRADYPPQVPADGELKISYRLARKDFEVKDTLQILQPKEEGIELTWTQPGNAPNQPSVVVKNYRLIFRKEKTLPIGSYGLDADNQGNRSDGLPSSNARALRTDKIITFEESKTAATVDPKTKEKKMRCTANLLKLLQDNAILPADEINNWRAEAWRVFIQTESPGGALSCLAPVKLNLEFDTEASSKLNPSRKLEVNPPRLEWISRPMYRQVLPPEDEMADVDFAAYPMPNLTADLKFRATIKEDKLELNVESLKNIQADDVIFITGAKKPENNGTKRILTLEVVGAKAVFTFPVNSFIEEEIKPELTISRRVEILRDDLKTLLEFRQHPEDRRAVRLQWNQAATAQRAAPLEMQAGYELYEFDLDAHTADVLDNPPTDFLERLRRVQETELLPTDALALTPDKTTAANQWEAWYPSHSRRRQIKLDAKLKSAAKFSQAKYSPWFSWRESYLEWADDKRIFTGKMEIKADEQILVLKEGNFPTTVENNIEVPVFKKGEFIRIIGAANAKNNGLKQISLAQELLPLNQIRLVAGSFAEKKNEEEIHLTLDRQTKQKEGSEETKPEKFLHPFLGELLDDLDTEEISVDLNPPPTFKAGSLDTILPQISAQQDPYGWNILKLFGLSAAFILRDRRTGKALAPADAQKKLRESLVRLVRVETEEFARHLFVENLFQPARSVRLAEEIAEPQNADLLSLLQISLRPTFRQKYRYWKIEIKGDVKIKRTIKIAPKPECALIELTDNPVETLLTTKDAPSFSREVTIPPSGTALLVLRATEKPEVVNCELIAIAPTDWLTTNFTSSAAQWTDDDDFLAAWGRFSAYLLRLNQTDAPPKEQIEIPKLDDAGFIGKLMPVLNRFFEAGGDAEFDNNGTGRTRTGAHLASAYPRTMSPFGIAPDEEGRLTYYHKLEDKWAHVYRYYFLPHHRYDRLWQSLAQSDALFYDDSQKKPELNWFEPPPMEAGGLDVVLDRIKEIAAPLVLFSGRLDKKAEAGEIVPPGPTWEVIVAKHPEQTMIERNRTLVRQLDYRHIAHTLVRRFAFGEQIKTLDTEMSLITKAYGAEDKITESAEDKIEFIYPKIVDGKEVEIVLPISLTGKNNLTGLREAIHVQAELQGKIESKLVKEGDKKILSLTLILSENKITDFAVRSTPNDENSNILKRSFSIAENLMPVNTSNDVELPTPIEKPEHLRLDNLKPYEKLALDLPNRLGAFSTGAIVMQWESLPFFYEHQLLLVAQTSTQVSDVTSVIQREFQYQTPKPAKPEYEFFDAPDKDGRPRRRIRMRIELKTFWDSLADEETRRRWASEEAQSGDKKLKFSALPDTEIIYQIAVVGDKEVGGGVFEPQAEVFFDADKKTGVTHYNVRQFGKHFEVESLKVDAPPSIPADKRFFLTAALTKINRLTLARDPQNPREIKGDLTLAEYRAELAKLFPDLAKLFPADASPMTMRRYAAAVGVANQPPLSVEIEKIFGFLTVPSGEIILYARRLLDESERATNLAELLPKFAGEEDKIRKLFSDLADREAFEQFFRDWRSERLITSRRDFRDTAESDRVEFPAPMSCLIALDVKNATEADIEKLRNEFVDIITEQNLFDKSFRKALSLILAQLNQPNPAANAVRFLTAEACVGLEQIREISLTAEVDAETRKIIWRGAISQDQKDTLKNWQDGKVSDFSETFKSVSAKVEAGAFRFVFTFTMLAEFPAVADLPPILTASLSVAPTAEMQNTVAEAVWLGTTTLSDDEKTELLRLQTNENFSEPFRAAIERLLAAFEPNELQTIVEIPIVEANWRSRATGGLSALLKNRLNIANGILRFYGWMTTDEKANLSHNQKAFNVNAVEKIFADSVKRGSATIELSARRGAAKIEKSE